MEIDTLGEFNAQEFSDVRQDRVFSEKAAGSIQAVFTSLHRLGGPDSASLQTVTFYRGQTRLDLGSKYMEYPHFKTATGN